jgi:hypothetical protein
MFPSPLGRRGPEGADEGALSVGSLPSTLRITLSPKERRCSFNFSGLSVLYEPMRFQCIGVQFPYNISIVSFPNPNKANVNIQFTSKIFARCSRKNPSSGKNLSGIAILFPS